MKQCTNNHSHFAAKVHNTLEGGGQTRIEEGENIDFYPKPQYYYLN